MYGTRSYTFAAQLCSATQTEKADIHEITDRNAIRRCSRRVISVSIGLIWEVLLRSSQTPPKKSEETMEARVKVACLRAHALYMAWKGRFQGNKGRWYTIETTCVYDTWIWHLRYGQPGSFDDLSTLKSFMFMSCRCRGKRYIFPGTWWLTMMPDLVTWTVIYTRPVEML